MEITYETLLERIEADPMEHLGGYSHKLIYSYFSGYEQARDFHSWPKIGGHLSMKQFNEWFMNNAYRGPQGWASYCEFLTDTEEEALRLFFEFRKLAMKNVGSSEEHNETSVPGDSKIELTAVDLIASEAMRARPAMYFGNSRWIHGIWSMWHGYISAERDMGVRDSPDCVKFVGFQRWLWERHEFAQDKNWGKLFQFLGMDVNAQALEQFYDHFDLFLEGAAPDGRTKRFQEFLDVAIASALEEQKKNESKP